MFLADIVLVSGAIAYGIHIRKYELQSDRLELFLIVCFAVPIIVAGWLSGTHFTVALLLQYIGLAIAMPMANIRNIKALFFIMLLCLMIFSVIEVFRLLPYAPMINQPLYDGLNNPHWAWSVFISLFAVMTSSFYLFALLATERWAQRENHLKLDSITDSLTGLFNRSYLFSTGTSEFTRSLRMADQDLSCIMLDIDHFKSINDTYGHAAGDHVLKQIATKLTLQARSSDITARYGGEEFVVLLPQCSQDEATIIAERIRTSIEQAPIEHGDETLSVTASFGVASSCALPQGATFETLLQQADTALYEAKRAGRNQVSQAIR
ncbi:GGDEF domain-containing protein [Alcanivorax sp. 1008]|uniref:GGDEF domain-containing protein n=1 Tax=Alcanivorax sp. 1008 TaxID=2816853 RepID=UPI001D24E895|nr:GGDEF domain-containing protein [Alcanivorax sp. 1008]MCC1495679.1 GGDEF domain-containing protein [Alcanivorax sp. 1008]